MENEPEVIRRQMEDTRTALTNKLEMLEQQVVETVQGASTAVAETVASVKEIVHESVQTVKDSVGETVETVKSTFDLHRHVGRRPWTMLAGATALGFLGGYLLRGSRAGKARENRRAASPAVASRSRTAVAPGSVPEDRHSRASDAIKARDVAPIFATNEHNLLANLGDTFHAEISQLKGLAVGTLFGIIRDIVMESVPKPMERQVEEMIDGITVKLGGQPLRGRLLPEGCESEWFGGVENRKDHGLREQSDPRDLPPRALSRA